jgi:flagellar hook-associated protein 3 FlgL
LNRNANLIDGLYQQYSTGKKIIHASENPIIASRALKFRTNISNTEQFQRNAAQGLSWMEITEYGFININETLREIRTLINQSATGTNEISDRQANMARIQTLFEGLQSEMNIDFAGRYVFSGFRTDHPPTFTQQSLARFEIEQNFIAGDIERTLNFVQTGIGEEPEVYAFNRIKLPYTFNIPFIADPSHIGPPPAPRIPDPNAKDIMPVIMQRQADDSLQPFPFHTATDTTAPALRIVERNDPTAFSSIYPEGHIHEGRFLNFIATTGEIVMDDLTARELIESDAGFTLIYTKEGFAKGELNPIVYFTTSQLLDDEQNSVGMILPQEWVAPVDFTTTNPITITAGSPLLTDYTVLVDTPIPLGTVFSHDVLLSDGVTVLLAGNPSMTGDEILAGEVIAAGEVLWFDVTIPPGTAVAAGTIVPAGTEVPWKIYDMKNQQMKYEFGLNTQFQINNLSKDILTPTLYADLRNLIEFTNSVQLSSEDEIRNRLLRDFPYLATNPEELAERIKQQQIKEDGMYRDVMFDRLNNMLRLIDNHTAKISTEFTALGSRMNRLEMINERLEQDRLSYTRLMSENENVDYIEVIMRLNAAEAVYQASLMAGASIMQLTLADFIR